MACRFRSDMDQGFRSMLPSGHIPAMISGTCIQCDFHAVPSFFLITSLAQGVLQYERCAFQQDWRIAWRRLFLAALLTVVSFTLCVKPVCAAVDPGVAISAASFACRSDAIDVATSYQGKILKSDVLDDAITEEWTELTLDALADLCVSFNTDPGWDTIFGLLSSWR